MAERRKKRRTKQEEGGQPMTKEEEAVAKYIRFNIPCKKIGLVGTKEKVDYFFASKAVDCLLDSKWASGKGKAAILFTSRSSCADYLNRLLFKGLFYRARKVYKKEGKSKTETDDDDEAAKSKSSSKRDDKEDKPKKKSSSPGAAAAVKEKEKESESEAKQKKTKRKFKLEMHSNQQFIDGNEPYVWNYDPISTKSILIGLGLLLLAIAFCLFPLWPPQVQILASYACYLALGILGVFFAVAACSYTVFSVVWMLSRGHVHIWILPNLFADCSILESFKPIYSIKYPGTDEKQSAEKKSKKSASSQSKESDSDEPNEQRTGKGSDESGEGAADRAEERDGNEEFEMIDKDEAEDLEESDRD